MGGCTGFRNESPETAWVVGQISEESLCALASESLQIIFRFPTDGRVLAPGTRPPSGGARSLVGALPAAAAAAGAGAGATIRPAPSLLALPRVLLPPPPLLLLLLLLVQRLCRALDGRGR
jgi:hypothetical protein